MNAEKCVNVLGNIFHFETITGENGNYELSSNYWDLKFNVRIDKTKIIIENTPGGTEQRIYFEDDETSIARSLMAFIGLVLRDESHNYTYDGTNGILAWPYNCNFAYIDKLKECMNEGESETYDRVESSRKLIKSGFAQRNAGIIMDKLDKCNQLIETCISISPDARLTRRLEELEDEVDDIAIQAEMLSNGDEQIQSSMQGQERGIQAIMDEYGCSREEAIDIMNGEVTSGKTIKSGLGTYNRKLEWLLDKAYVEEYRMISNNSAEVRTRHTPVPLNSETMAARFKDEIPDGYELQVDFLGEDPTLGKNWDLYEVQLIGSDITSGCHGKAKKKAKKEIKSSLKEEFDQALSDNSTEWPEDEYNACLDSFKNEFAKDHNITYEEVDKIYNELQDEWFKNADNAGIPDIYSSVTRNHKNIQALYN